MSQQPPQQPATTPPAEVSVYSQSPVFTQATAPEKMRQAHKTKAGVYGQVNVLSGAMDFHIVGPPHTTTHLAKGDGMLVLPEQEHYVEIDGPVRFQIDFLK